MALFTHLRSALLLTLAYTVPISKGASFTFTNQCEYTIWPGILSNAGTPPLATTGFQLPTLTSRSLHAPPGWSGRFWARTGCNFDSGMPGFCATGDCGSGSPECGGAGPQPPATLAEFTLGAGAQDFYDVSLVDGYNVPVLVEPVTAPGAEACAPTGCLVDLNRVCPSELRAGNGEACMSACEAFARPEYCCSGVYGSPATCKPTVYSEVFKAACPRAYSYAYDDGSSIFTCTGADYIITFCPSYPRQLQKSRTTPVIPTITNTLTPPGTSNEFRSGDGSGSSGIGSEVAGSGSESRAMVTDGSWLARLAMGDSTKITPANCFAYPCLSLLLALLSISAII